MSVNVHHRGHREIRKRGRRPSARLLCLLIGAAILFLATAARPQTRQPLPLEKRIRYQIQLALDYENRAYTGTERVRWVNRGDHPTSTMFFHLDRKSVV